MFREGNKIYFAVGKLERILRQAVVMERMNPGHQTCFRFKFFAKNYLKDFAAFYCIVV